MAGLKNDKFISVPDRFGLAPRRAATAGKAVGGADLFFGGEAPFASSMFSCSWTDAILGPLMRPLTFRQSCICLAQTLHGLYRHSFPFRAPIFFLLFDDCHARSFVIIT